jgi:hypothetical protein
MPQLTESTPTASESPAVMEALRNKIRQLEKKEAATQRQMELMRRRSDQQETDRKIQQIAEKQKAQARCDKLEALLEKGEMQARFDKLESNTKQRWRKERRK